MHMCAWKSLLNSNIENQEVLLTVREQINGKGIGEKKKNNLRTENRELESKYNYHFEVWSASALKCWPDFLLSLLQLPLY